MSTYEPHSMGWWMDERRGELRLTWDQVAERAGVSTETLYRAASGRPMRTTTRKGIERALVWTNGSVASIQAGRAPTRQDGPDPESASGSRSEFDELREMAAAGRALAEESFEYFSKLEERLDQLGQPGERRAAR